MVAFNKNTEKFQPQALSEKDLSMVCGGLDISKPFKYFKFGKQLGEDIKKFFDLMTNKKDKK